MELVRLRPLLVLPVLGLFFFLGIFIFLRQRKSEYIEIDINGEIFLLEIADTAAKRAEGLMGRDFLKEDEGMLFIFPTEDKHSIWMYNTKIPLDIAWLDKNWEMVHVEKNVPPCESTNPLDCPKYTSPVPAKYVVELNAGTL